MTRRSDLRAGWMLALAATVVGASLPGGARAAQSYDSCSGFIDQLPAVISTQGVWCLRKDLAVAIVDGEAISVTANNVTIDCNHFKLGGQTAGAGTRTLGIFASNRANIVVRRCNIRGFNTGVRLAGTGGGNVIEDNRFDGNTQVGVSVSGNGSTVRRNVIRSTGGSTVDTGTAGGISVSGASDVLDNTVDTVVPLANVSGDASAFGISGYQSGGGSISRNRVRGLVSLGNGEATGILVAEGYRVILAGNHVVHAGTAGAGLRCVWSSGGSGKDQAKDNIISGFPTAVAGCEGVDNEVVP